MSPIVFLLSFSFKLNNYYCNIFFLCYSIEIETICSCECEKYAEQNSLECSGVSFAFKVLDDTHNPFKNEEKYFLYNNLPIYRLVRIHVDSATLAMKDTVAILANVMKQH